MSYDISIINVPTIVPPLDEIEYQIDSQSPASIPASVGDNPVGLLMPGSYSNRIRGKNSVGYGPWSVPKVRVVGWDDLFSYYSLGQGFVYDMSRIDTMWQDHLQTNPVTDYGQPVGYQLDLSGNGNHRSQSDVAKRPIYGRHPASGPRNLIRSTEVFNVSPWSGASRDTAQDLGDGVFRLPNFGDAVGARLSQAVASAPSLQYTVSIDVRGEGDDIGKTVQVIAIRNTTGTLVNTIITATLTESWQRVSATVTLLADNTGIELRLSRPTTNFAQAPLIRRAQLELGPEMTAYQRVGTTLWDITEVGSPDCFFIAYDGINDVMQTVATVNGTASDEATCIVSQRREFTGEGSFGLVEHGLTANTNGSFAILSQLVGTSRAYNTRSRGTIERSGTSGSVAPFLDRAVICLQAKISAPFVSLTRNGNTISNITTDQGTGNYGNHFVVFGARGSLNAFHVGREYFNFGAFKLLTTEQRNAIESLAGQKAGVSW